MHGTERIQARNRRLAVWLAGLGCALALSACGGSGSPQKGSDPRQAAGVAFADCMRSHGVSNFPDPGPGGGIQIPSGVNPQSPAFQSAQTACSKLMPGGPGPGAASESDKLRMLNLARCMRVHGVPSFPDPTSTAPSPGTGFGLAFGRPGSFIAVPQTLLQSPGFKQAASECDFPGAGPRGGGRAELATPG